MATQINQQTKSLDTQRLEWIALNLIGVETLAEDSQFPGEGVQLTWFCDGLDREMRTIRRAPTVIQAFMNALGAAMSEDHEHRK